MDYFYNDESGKRAGPIPENAIHALFSGGLINGTTQVAAADTGNWMSYDSAFGIIDGPVPPAPSKLPPVLATSEPGVLAGHVGQVVMVVRANETSRRAIADALALVNACPTVSFLLNQVAKPQRFNYYGESPAAALG